MQLENLTNIIAMIFSLVAIIFLSVVSFKIGGTIGRMMKFIVAGIFFSVFAHAGVELIGSFGLISEKILLTVMGALLIVGSGLFIIGGYLALKILK